MEHHCCDYTTVGFDEKGKYTYMRIKQKGDSDQFRMAHDKVFEIYKKEQPGRHLADTRGMGVVSLDDQKFVSQNFLPRVVEFSPNNCIKIAVLVSEDAFSKFAVESIGKKMSEMPANIQHKMFKSEEEAVGWLCA
ncbi:hypothetical protein QQ008_11665 [Fulvivirgaceae bacterium BMA10]|uniref:STAS/SEC14 domain-containing protein n=1 Tax=Splendidivirga corallicola TaxID=3051826 RepID=A0ABT8KMR9_9BACT|nr:hypothetical protein [Fulvivirgaceae bacterium BMA10]